MPSFSETAWGHPNAAEYLFEFRSEQRQLSSRMMAEYYRANGPSFSVSSVSSVVVLACGEMPTQGSPHRRTDVAPLAGGPEQTVHLHNLFSSATSAFHPLMLRFFHVRDVSVAGG